MAGVKSNEGGTDYDALGDKNNEGQYTAAGIGQWSNQVNGIPQALQKGQVPTNFANDAKTYGLDPTDFSPANQNKVMYAVLAAGKKKGWTPEQELSAWNSGDPNKYLSEDASGTGPVGSYNVAGYVQRGMKAAQAYSQKNNQPGSNYNPTPFSNPNPGEVNYSGDGSNPIPSSSPSQPLTLGSVAKGAMGLLQGAEKPFIGLAAAPTQLLAKALGQSDPYQQGIGGGQAPSQIDPLASTAGGIAEQEAGNAAQVGSYFVPGGEGIVPVIAGGATMGLLQGAGNAMSNQGNLTDVATQGAEGAALGGGTAGLLAGAGGFLSKTGEGLTGEGMQKAVQGLKNAYGSALNLNASERGFETRSGKDLAQVLMDNGASLGRNDNGTLDASDAIEKLQGALDPLNEKANAIVSAPGMNENVANFVPLSKVQDSVIDAIKTSNIDSEVKETSISNALSLFKATKREYGDVVSPQVGEKIKQGLQNTVFKKTLTTSDALQGNVKYLASNEMRKAIEGAVQGTPEGDAYGALNAQRSDLVDAIKRLTKLDGVRTVKGGRLGKMAGGLTGAIIGGSTGNPLLALAGDYFGGKAAEFLNNPATKIAMARAKLGVAGVAPKALGVAAKPIGKVLNGTGDFLQKGARPTGLLGNLILNSQNKN